MISQNLLYRVFRISDGTDTGTCFSMEHDGHQYLITAKHVVGNFNGKFINIFHDNEWKQINVKLVGHGSGSSDITVFAPEKFLLSATGGVVGSYDKMTLSQDAYLLGYPLELMTDIAMVNYKFPIPVIKKGIISALNSDSSKKSALVDVNVNPGFSGGPLIYFNLNDNNRTPYVGGVVVSSLQTWEPVYDREDRSPRHETKYRMLADSGFGTVHSIEHAIDAIKDNPIHR